MPALILVPQRLHLFDHVLRRHAAILVEIALAMVAERAAAPVAAARREIGNDPLRHEVADPAGSRRSPASGSAVIFSV